MSVSKMNILLKLEKCKTGWDVTLVLSWLHASSTSSMVGNGTVGYTLASCWELVLNEL